MFGKIRLDSLALLFTQTDNSTEMNLLGWSQLKKIVDFGVLRPSADNRHEIVQNADSERTSLCKYGNSDKVTGL